MNPVIVGLLGLAALLLIRGLCAWIIMYRKGR